MGMLAVLLLAVAVTYFAFPDFSNRWIMVGEINIGKLLARLGLGGDHENPVLDPGPQQAHFTNIDGMVRVKKASSNTWVTADYSLALERNDIVQTSSEGMAKVVFADGANYTVKPDSLIVIQENSVNAAQQTKVAVQVSTGTVDLTTANIGRGSRSQVTVEGATATFAPDSAAQVMNDPRNDQHEILLKKGGAEVTRGTQTLAMSDYDKVTFTADSKQMVKSKEIRPPFLISPRDKDTYQTDPKSRDVVLTWGPVEGVHGYHVKVSKSKFFTQPSLLVDDKNWPNLEMRVKGLEPNQMYYWEVFSVGEDGKESTASEINGFNLVVKGDNSAAIPLELEPFSQHGHVIEVKGRTEPGARVLVNGQEAIINSDGTFRHFTNPLPTGDNVITVTAQNQKGGSATNSQTITIQ